MLFIIHVQITNIFTIKKTLLIVDECLPYANHRTTEAHKGHTFSVKVLRY